MPCSGGGDIGVLGVGEVTLLRVESFCGRASALSDCSAEFDCLACSGSNGMDVGLGVREDDRLLWCSRLGSWIWRRLGELSWLLCLS